MESKERGERFAALAAAGLLLVWRIAAVPLPSLWRDWIAILAVVLLLSQLVTRPDLRRILVAGSSAFLLAVYCAGQLPQTFRALGLLP